jgi:predicted nuclease with TOPRIM domain
MTDVSTAQQATEARALAHTVERGHTYLLKGDRNHVVLLLNLYADLLLAAAEQREQLDELRIAYGEAMVALTEQGDAYVKQREQIATLTAERDQARAQAKKWFVQTPRTGYDELAPFTEAQYDATLTKLKREAVEAFVWRVEQRAAETTQRSFQLICEDELAKLREP